MGKKIPTPKADPRGYEHLMGTPMDVKDHPARNVPTPAGTDAFKEVTSAAGDRAAYSATTNQMNYSVGIQDAIRNKLDD